jgi:DNA-binding NarL/FixJ family response regulator
MTFPLRILIAENQYLIAMEVERMLVETLACEVTIAPLTRLQEELPDNRYDIVLLDATTNEALNAQRVEAIRMAGAEPVFLSSYGHINDRQSTLALHPSVTKPPLPEQLSAAVLEAAGRRHSGGKSLLDDR